jgi:drug/metabolite transporter (DMT)-like permease
MQISLQTNAGILLQRQQYVYRSFCRKAWILSNVYGGRIRVNSVCKASKDETGDSSDEAPSDLACYGTGVDTECIVPESRSVKESDKNKGKGILDGERSNVATPTLATFLFDWILLISPFFFWGTSMVAMKEVSPHTTPWFVAAWRLVPAGLVLLGWAAIERRQQPQSATAWLAIALFGLADGTCFQGFLAEGLQRTSAGLGSVIIDSQPLTVAVLASILFGEKLGLWGIVGLFVGILGLLMLELPPSYFSSLPLGGEVGAISELASLPSQNGHHLWDSGEWWMLLAAQSMAIGTVMVRWVAKYCDPIVATGWHMILGGIPLVILAAMQDQSTLVDRLSLLTVDDAFLLVYVSLFGSAASYGVFFYEATVRGNLTALSSLTFLTPMFAAAAGYFALGETLSPFQLAGATVTLGAVGLISSASKSGNDNDSDSDGGRG